MNNNSQYNERGGWVCRKGHSNPDTKTTCKECEDRINDFRNEMAIINPYLPKAYAKRIMKEMRIIENNNRLMAL